MGSTERRERERQAVQTLILDATRAILSEQGYEGLTMRAVAERVEYSTAALYKHFTDCEELVRALCSRDFYAFAQMLNARPSTRPSTKVNGPVDPIDRLRGIGQSYAEFASRHPEQYRVMFMAPTPVHPAIVHGNPEQDAYALVAQAVQDALDVGHFKGFDKDLVAQTLWATVHGVVSIEICHLPIKERQIPFAPLALRVEIALEGILLGLEALARRRTQENGTSSVKSTRAVKSPKPATRPVVRRKSPKSGRSKG